MKYEHYEAPNMKWKILVGKKIKSLWINDAKDVLKIGTDTGDYFASAVGDCCSRSWFEHFAGTEALIGHTVREIIEHESLELKTGNPLKGKETDCEQKYGWTFVTEYGRADLDMRNDSNGYYGGEAVVSDVVQNQYSTEVETPETKPLTEDF